MARTRAEEIAAQEIYGGRAPVMPATILNGASLSQVLDFGSMRIGAILFPAAWTAASLTLRAGYDGVNVSDLLDASGTEYTITVTAGKLQLVTFADLLSFSTLQLRSGTSAAAVNQAADRAFSLFMVP